MLFTTLLPLGLPQLPFPKPQHFPLCVCLFPPLEEQELHLILWHLWHLQMPSTWEILKIRFLNPTERFIGKSPNHRDLCFYLYRILCKLGHRRGVTADSKGTGCF